MVQRLGDIIESALILCLSAGCAYSGVLGVLKRPIVLPFGGSSPNHPINIQRPAANRVLVEGSAARAVGVLLLLLSIAFLVGAMSMWW
jgi:hypothetical protein